VSLVLVAGFATGSFLIGVSYYNSKKFRAVVGGFKAETISTIINRVIAIP